MQNAARARRSRGGYGRSNVGQVPADVFDSNLEAETSVPATSPVECSSAASSSAGGQRLRAIAMVPSVPNFVWNSVPRALSATGYERMRIQLDFDPLALSSLATFHIGQTAAKTLSREPSRLGDVLKFRQWSYFNCEYWAWLEILLSCENFQESSVGELSSMHRAASEWRLIWTA